MNIFSISTNYDCWHDFKVGNTVELNDQAYTIISIYAKRRKFVIKGHYYGHPDLVRVVSGDEIKMLGLQGK